MSDPDQTPPRTMLRERRTKQNYERKQRALQAEQQRARTPTPSPSHHSSRTPTPSQQPSSSQPTPSEEPSSSRVPSARSSSSASSYHPSQSGSSQHSSDSFDTEERDAPSEEHTDEADEYEAEFFPITTRRQLRHFKNLKRRTFENTRVVDFTALSALGIEQEFRSLTSRIGLTPAFWAIDHKGYKKLTHEFLSSLELKWNRNERPYIKFQLGHQTHRVWVSTLREWFGFEDDPDTATLSFHDGLDKDHFWNLISGMEPGSVVNSQFKSLNVPHPVLRITLRIIGATVFARGETVARANVEDLQLLDHMLRPASQLERPDLMLIMIHHWLYLQSSTRKGGVISISAYVTLIADRLEIPTPGVQDRCKGPRYLDLDSFRAYKYIAIEHGPTGRTYSWRMPDDRTFYRMPFPVSLSYADRSTWYFSQPPQAAHAPRSPTPVQVHTPSPHDDDVEMTDAHTSPQQIHTSPPTAAGPSHHHASTSHAAGPSRPSDPTAQDMYSLISAMQATQLDILSTQSAIQASLREQGDDLSDIRMEFATQGSRITAIEAQLRDWRFYEEHGYWPAPPAP